MRNVCTEAGMFAIRDERDYVIEEDFMKAVRKVAENKKLESTPIKVFVFTKNNSSNKLRKVVMLWCF